MPKYYIMDNREHRLVLTEHTPHRAAEAFIRYWQSKHIKVGNCIGMNEVGFESNVVDTDHIFDTSNFTSSTE